MPVKWEIKRIFLLSFACPLGPLRGVCPSALTLVLGARQVLRGTAPLAHCFSLLFQGLLVERVYFVTEYYRPLGVADFL